MSTVSVIMPCYNHGKFLNESIESVLSQKYPDLELIIINDHSTDDSGDIIESYKKQDKRIVLVQHDENMGASRSRNEGILRSKGEFIAFCDADDMWMPEKLSIQLNGLMDKCCHNIVYCDSMIIDEDGVPTGDRFSFCFRRRGTRSGRIFRELCLGNFVNLTTGVVNKRCITDGELFDEKIEWVEDWMFWIKLAKKHAFLYVDQVLAKYRVHSQHTAFVHRRGNLINRLKVYNKVLDKYSDILPKQKSKILYQIGIAYAQLGRKKVAKKCFLNAALYDKTNIRALMRLIVPKPELRFGD